MVFFYWGLFWFCLSAVYDQVFMEFGEMLLGRDWLRIVNIPVERERIFGRNEMGIVVVDLI